ncbi:hypothetical protein ES703_56964 [subsurface metagenome]
MYPLIEVALIAVVIILFSIALGFTWGICWERDQRIKTELKNMEKEKKQ